MWLDMGLSDEDNDRFDFFKKLDETTPIDKQSQLIDLAFDKKKEAMDAVENYEKFKGKKLSEERRYASKAIEALNETTKLVFKALSIGAERSEFEELERRLGYGNSLQFRVYMFTLIYGDNGVGPSGLAKDIPGLSIEDKSRVQTALKKLKKSGMVQGNKKNYRVIKNYREPSMKLFWDLIADSHRNYLLKRVVDVDKDSDGDIDDLDVDGGV